MSRERDRVLVQVRTWRDDLVNMSRRNKLLYFAHTKSSSLELLQPSPATMLEFLESRRHRLDFFDPLGSDETANEGRSSGVIPKPNEAVAHCLEGKELVPATAKRLRAIQKTLCRAATQEYLDKGLQSLYLGLGILKWFETVEDDDPHYAPLLLVPVELRGDIDIIQYVTSNDRVCLRGKISDKPYILYRQVEEDLVLNPALAIKLESDFGITLPSIEDYDETGFSDLEADIKRAVSTLTRWEVQDRAVLGRFAFHKDVMYRDLLENEDKVCEHDFVRALTDGVTPEKDYAFEEPPEERLDELAPPEHAHCVLDADSSQRKCIWAATCGKSFVMDGPPGTGKSQTIANMIGELIAEGKTVLFVSEKAAALEVVYKRLEEKGLNEYVLQLHSHKTTRREVASELGRSLRLRPRLEKGMSSSQVDTLALRRQELNAYAEAMNEIRMPLGRSLHWAIGRLVQLSEAPASDISVGSMDGLSEARLQSILVAARQLAKAWGPVERGDRFLWRDLCLGNLTAAKRVSLKNALDNTHGLLLTVRDTASKVATLSTLPVPSSIADARNIAKLAQLLANKRSIPADWLLPGSCDAADAALAEVESHQSLYMSSKSAVRASLGDSTDLRLLGGAEAALTDAMAKLSSLNPALVLEKEVTFDEISDLQKAWATAAEKVECDFLQQFAELCGDFEIGGPCRTIDAAHGVFELLAVTDIPEKPKKEWFDSAQLALLKEARVALGGIVDSYRKTYEQVNEVFNDQVMLLPAADLVMRFRDVHKGVGTLMPAYWKDRRLLRPTCRLRKVTPQAIAALGDVANLQALDARLKEFAEKHAADFGDYYDGAKTDFHRVDHAIEAVEAALDTVSRHINLVGALPYIAAGPNVDQMTRLRIQSLRSQLGALCEFASGVLGVDSSRLSELDISNILESMRQGQEPLSQVLVVFARVRECGGDAASLKQLLEGLGQAEVALDASRDESAQETEHGSKLGRRYAGLQTDTRAIHDDLDWAKSLISAVKSTIDDKLAKTLLAARVSPHEISEALARWDESVQWVHDIFEPARASLVLSAFTGDFDEANDAIVGLLSSMDDIQEWDAYSSSLARLDGLGLGAIARFCVQERLEVGQVVLVIERRVLETWTDSVLEKDSEKLGPLRAAERDSLIAEFADLDAKFVDLTAASIMNACNNRRPTTALGSAAVIQREAEKKKKHMPIRRLLDQTRDVTLAIKPCFMMSPLTVSQFLMPDFKFDVVIFDEASQIQPQDAINCIYRGRQHIIAGDQKQLPPTSFFDAHADDGDEWEEDQVETYESILDKAKSSGKIPSMSLRWHYRSRHEDLITFSNYSFYEGNLITFPSPRDAVPPLGVGFTYVDGVYRRGGQRDNLIEARKVAQLVAQYSREYPDLSLGVIAFSQAQEAAIENAIDELRTSSSSLPESLFTSDRLDGFFVKNLETVQGDERDIIILSIGYGRDEDGRLTQGFGPINASGGYRRLNVAVTRARYRLELVASIHANDISEAAENEGVRHLRRYLDYAERGPSSLAFGKQESLGDCESPFEEEVARVIRSWGYDVISQVGCAGYRIDLGVRRPSDASGFAIGIECDGAAYHSSKNARDRDRLREEVLRKLGWRLYRIWGPSWYRQRSMEEEKLKEAIQNAMSEQGGSTSCAVKEPCQMAPSVVLEDVVLSQTVVASDWTTKYVVAEPNLSRADRSIPLGSPSAQPILWRAIPEVVQVEQPIHTSLLLERVRVAWGAGRSGSRIQSNFEMSLRHLVKKGVLTVDGSRFVWVVDQNISTLGVVRRPVSDDLRTFRTVEQVAHEEMVLAAQKCRAAVPGITHDDLSVQVASLFGWSRRSREISTAIDQAIDAACAETSWN